MVTNEAFGEIVMGISDGRGRAALFGVDAAGRAIAVAGEATKEMLRAVRRKLRQGVRGRHESREDNTVNVDSVELQPNQDVFWHELAQSLAWDGWLAVAMPQPWAELWRLLQTLPVGNEFRDLAPSTLLSLPEAEAESLSTDMTEAQREMTEIAAAEAANDAAEAVAIRRRALELAGLSGGVASAAV